MPRTDPSPLDDEPDELLFEDDEEEDDGTLLPGCGVGAGEEVGF